MGTDGAEIGKVQRWPLLSIKVTAQPLSSLTSLETRASECMYTHKPLTPHGPKELKKVPSFGEAIQAHSKISVSTQWKTHLFLTLSHGDVSCATERFL